jgi:hypothetical protein
MEQRKKAAHLMMRRLKRDGIDTLYGRCPDKNKRFPLLTAEIYFEVPFFQLQNQNCSTVKFASKGAKK